VGKIKVDRLGNYLKLLELEFRKQRFSDVFKKLDNERVKKRRGFRRQLGYETDVRNRFAVALAVIFLQAFGFKFQFRFN
jgi:hypothetical protein